MASTLLALHGMAGAGWLWDDVASGWDGPTILPDLAGHAHAARLDRYGPAAFADELAARLDLASISQQGALVVLGHSLGGVVACELARRHRAIRIDRVVTIGIKTKWSEDDLAGTARIADKGVRWFDDEAAARQWFCRVTGTETRLDPDDPRLGSVVERDAQGWRLCMDPEAYRVDRIDFGSIFSDLDGLVTASRGTNDPMVSTADLREFGFEVVELDDAGHNAHLDNPAAVRDLVHQFST